MERRDFLQKTGTLIGASIIPYQTEAEENPLISKIKQVEKELYKKTQEISTAQTPGMTSMTAGLVEVELPNNLKLSALFTDDPRTKISPDYLLTAIYKKQGNKYNLLETIMDNGLDGITLDKVVGPADHYAIRSSGGKVKNLVSSLNKEELKKVNKRLLSALTQILVYSENPKGEIIPIEKNDIGIQYPNEIPIPGLINWEESLQGFEVCNIDVLFHNKLVDRIKILKINPNKYRFGVHVNKDLLTIEEWQKSLDAVAVINGSFFQAEPNYGEPLTPIMTQGIRRGLKNYKSKSGAILFEPINPNEPLVKIKDYSQSTIADIENEGYKEGVVSYPTLLDFKGNVKAKKNPEWRANRTFIGMDNSKNVVFGNTQGGFFSLNRLGNFLKYADNLNLDYALNLDGGPPACMVVKAGNHNYVNYGLWETNDASGKEELYWNDKNKSKWGIPIVISAKKR